MIGAVVDPLPARSDLPVPVTFSAVSREYWFEGTAELVNVVSTELIAFPKAERTAESDIGLDSFQAACSAWPRTAVFGSAAIVAVIVAARVGSDVVRYGIIKRRVSAVV
jgi:hypothetical protein